MGLDPNLGYCNGGSCGELNLKHFSGLHEVGQFTSFIFNADLILVENSKIHLLEKNTLLPVDAKKKIDDECHLHFTYIF